MIRHTCRRRRRCHPHRHPLHSHRHTRPRHQADCHHNRNPLVESHRNRSRKSHQDHCKCRTHPRLLRRCQRHHIPHRHRRLTCTCRRKRPKRRADCHCSRRHQLGCQNIRTRRSLQDHCKCRRRRTLQCNRQRRHRYHLHPRQNHKCLHKHPKHQTLYAVIDVVTNAISVIIRTTHTSTNSENIELITLTIAIPCWNRVATAVVNRARTVADATCIYFTHTIVD